MTRILRTSAETDEVHRVLVGELAMSLLPTGIMSCTFVGVAGFAAWSQPSPVLGTAAISGGVLALLKVVAVLLHHRVRGSGDWPRPRSARWELCHAILTIGFAVHVGLVTALAFLGSDTTLQLLTTGMLFGYCSGVAARVSFRPVISSAALIAAAVPACVGAALGASPAGRILAVVFAVFLLGGLETVRYLYLVFVRQITTTLDMATLARRDPLTGLLNRLGLREEFRARMARHRPEMVAMHCLDLDGFKPLNDRFGHHMGDLLLIALAHRLSGILGSTGLIARLGGDEFAVLQIEIASAEEADALALRLSRAVRAPFQIDGAEIRVGTSIGYTTSAVPYDLEALIEAADGALYRAKRVGCGVASTDSALAA